MMNEFIDNEVKFNWNVYFNQLCKRAERLLCTLKETETSYTITIDNTKDMHEFKNLIDVENFLFSIETILLIKLNKTDDIF
jgi:hypothetical protein